MYDSHTWPETRRSETFHSQASKLWEFVTDELVSDVLCILTLYLPLHVLHSCSFMLSDAH